MSRSNSDRSPYTYFRSDPVYGYGLNYGYGEGFRTTNTGFTTPCCAPSYSWDKCWGTNACGRIPGYYDNRNKYVPTGCFAGQCNKFW